MLRPGRVGGGDARGAAADLGEGEGTERPLGWHRGGVATGVTVLRVLAVELVGDGGDDLFDGEGGIADEGAADSGALGVGCEGEVVVEDVGVGVVAAVLVEEGGDGLDVAAPAVEGHGGGHVDQFGFELGELVGDAFVDGTGEDPGAVEAEPARADCGVGGGKDGAAGDGYVEAGSGGGGGDTAGAGEPVGGAEPVDVIGGAAGVDFGEQGSFGGVEVAADAFDAADGGEHVVVGQVAFVHGGERCRP